MFKNKVDTYISRTDYTYIKMLDSRYTNGFFVHLPSGPLPSMAILLYLVKYMTILYLLLCMNK